MAITGVNHITLACSDLPRSIAFYRDILGADLRAEWANGAYLELGALWLCLSLNNGDNIAPRADYSHTAFNVPMGEFALLAARISATAALWKTNQSEGASLYFIDPDGHKLELHSGTIETRIAQYRTDPAAGVTIYERGDPA